MSIEACKGAANLRPPYTNRIAHREFLERAGISTNLCRFCRSLSSHTGVLCIMMRCSMYKNGSMCFVCLLHERLETLRFRLCLTQYSGLSLQLSGELLIIYYRDLQLFCHVRDFILMRILPTTRIIQSGVV